MLPQGIEDFLCKLTVRIVVPRSPSGNRGKLVRGRSFLNLKGGQGNFEGACFLFYAKTLFR